MRWDGLTWIIPLWFWWTGLSHPPPFRIAIASARIACRLWLPETGHDRFEPRQPCPGNPLLEFENVTVFYGTKKVLDSLSITIREGENIAILGPNGAGKSSFIRTMLREFYPAAGDEEVIFRMHGKDVWDVFELRSTIGIVSNDLQYTFTRPITGQRGHPLRVLLQCRALQPVSDTGNGTEGR